ncbi:hypothetical protein LTR36_004734 [Oleoguttula mirabilis]|uniref:Uncharacterized protein n=1 Tax=Oleoguttula mirabilis TaxID=1507867 RepID=A0AAV9JFJ6_9PEZI|nr:hypothetical protein LTR36_004734 [Oleoguttula mirabilis]
MGVTLSSTSTLAPISFASTVIGFISFTFTLGTFIKVLWVNFETLGEAQHEVHAYLTNLRTELLEERASLRVMKKNCKRHHRLVDRGDRADSGLELDDVTLKTMSDAVKHLIKRFSELERPFLEKGELGIADVTNHQRKRRRDESGSPYYNHSAYASPTEKADARSRTDHDREARLPRYANENNDDNEDGDGDRYWAQRTRYAHYSFWKRMKWLYKKAEAQQLFETLSRVQTRRIARQVGAIAVVVHEYGSSSMDMEEMVRRIDERMSRFVGVRRVEDG